MKSNRKSLLPVALTVSGLLSITNAFAVPLIVTHTDVPNCDPLFVPQLVDEIGLAVGGFPPGELLASADIGPGPPVCLPSDGPPLDFIVSITNLNAVSFTEVWYVADPDTSISNFDGFVMPLGGTFLEAFRIDTVGINTPLLFESFAADGVWSPGETWDFVIQDYLNAAGLLPSALGSIGLGSPIPLSSGSIIAIPVVIPIPAAAWLFGGALAGLAALKLT
ncbi:MAG: hypothetical protein E4H19_12210 [Chromatiales bacterium]|jgi:hypothetical protein|nr:MAG: hypothetical protein E4H19_12210 [Chromatiales bacterium]